jgi:signal transduction histidine kinase
MISKIPEHWKRLSLAKQFAVAALGVLLPGAVATAWWIPDKINEAVIKNTAAVTVLYMDGLLAPLLSELETTGNLSPDSRNKLGKLVQQSKSSGKIISIKIWNLDGTIIYSTFDDMIGQKFELSAEMEQAKQGFLAADFKNIGEEENKHERAVGVPLLEVYAPVRDPKTRNIIAISEFYADGSDLNADINYATRMSWLLVGGAASLLLGALSLIVSRGSQTISAQREELVQKVRELQNMLAQNEELRINLRQSNENVADINERFLQRIGAELHDGPAQKLAYSVLRTSSVRRLLEAADLDQAALNDIRTILQQAIREVRIMSTGLMLPELEALDLSSAARMVVKLHEDYTGSKVSLKIDLNNPYMNQALKTCVYRLIQEALTNTYKHAGGAGAAVTLNDRNGIEVVISDTGQGIKPDHIPLSGLGHFGMRSRVFALGGKLDIVSAPNVGTTVTAWFPNTLDWS